MPSVMSDITLGIPHPSFLIPDSSSFLFFLKIGFSKNPFYLCTKFTNIRPLLAWKRSLFPIKPSHPEEAILASLRTTTVIFNYVI